MLSVLSNRTYRRLFLAQVIALIGTGLATVALGLLAYDLAGVDAGAVLGTALAVKMVAYVGVAPIAAAFADRLPRRTMLVALDLIRAAVAAASAMVIVNSVVIVQAGLVLAQPQTALALGMIRALSGGSAAEQDDRVRALCEETAKPLVKGVVENHDERHEFFEQMLEDARRGRGRTGRTMAAQGDHAGHDHDGGDHSGHAHGPGGHAHAPANFGKAFAIGIGLNTAFVIIEAAYGYASNSLALVADAGHNLSDVLGLVVAWVAATLARRPPSPRFSYGLRSSSIMAALFNAIFLLIAVGMIAWEAIQRVFDPQPVAGVTVMVVAAIGVVVNGFTAFLFMSGRKGDINIKGAYIHMLADAGVSVAVIVAGLLVVLTGWQWLDPATSLAIAVVITVGTWGLLRDSVTMSLNATPPGVDPAAVGAFLRERPGVIEVHDLHIWPMSTTETALTAHLVIPGGHPGDAAMRSIAEELEERFGIAHATIQIELEAGHCPLAPAHAV